MSSWALAAEREQPLASHGRVFQVADYVCTMGLAALRYRDGEPTPTDDKFFGGWQQFKHGILKEIRAKQI